MCVPCNGVAFLKCNEQPHVPDVKYSSGKPTLADAKAV